MLKRVYWLEKYDCRNKTEIKPSDQQSTQKCRYQSWPEEEHVEIFKNFGGM